MNEYLRLAQMMTAGHPTWVPQAPKFGRKDNEDHVYASNFLVISVELFFWGRVVWRGRGNTRLSGLLSAVRMSLSY